MVLRHTLVSLLKSILTIQLQTDELVVEVDRLRGLQAFPHCNMLDYFFSGNLRQYSMEYQEFFIF